MHLELLQKESLKKQQKQLVISLVLKLLTELQTKFSKKSQQINSETITNWHDKKILKERSPEEIQEIIDELRLK